MLGSCWCVRRLECVDASAYSPIRLFLEEDAYLIGDFDGPAGRDAGPTLVRTIPRSRTSCASHRQIGGTAASGERRGSGARPSLAAFLRRAVIEHGNEG